MSTNMEIVKNKSGKIVCRVDKKSRLVEISSNGCLTVIKFNENGTVSTTTKYIA